MKEEKSKVGALDESLYSRTRYKDPSDSRVHMNPDEPTDIPPDWQGRELDEMLLHQKKDTEGHPIMRKFFIFAVIFFVIATGLAAFVYFGGGNLVSSKNVEISILGPVSVSAGDPIELGVTILNKNNADLTSVNMFIDYPEGSRSAEDSNINQEDKRLPLEEISSGREIVINEKAILFGQKGDVKEIRISLSYKVKGSNATFTKEKVYEVNINSAPVTMTIERSPSVASGEVFTTTISVVSNSNEILKGILVRGEYPYGYSVVESVPKAVLSNNVWSLGDLAPGDKRTVMIKGVISGENEEERTFRFYTGLGSSDNPEKFTTPITALSETVSINRSSVGLSVRLNGDTSNPYVAPGGKSIQASVSYKNNLPSNIQNAKVQVKLAGNILDKFSVKAQNGGFYNSVDNTITWDKTSNSKLSTIGPGDEGEVLFSFASLPSASGSQKNSEITLTSNFSAEPQSRDTSLNLVATKNNSVKIASEVALSAKAVYSRGPFQNTGPVPPKAEAETTYTITMNLGNTRNDVYNPKVVATLGSNVKWLGETSPETETITFDETTRIVTWQATTLLSGTGFSAPGREISFKISLTPSIGQIGTTPILVQGISFSGTDAFTSESMSVNAPSVTTRINSDPTFVQGDELVVK
ncbi:MAG: hypothetical protein AB200_01970 [Parcubacteria bacterium C7867-005]|nr:MAG: hypothetical protein AB200_01970 [Parcubacteria bacterium C7867-005]